MPAQLAKYCLLAAVISPVVVAPNLDLSFGKYVLFRLCVELAAALLLVDWAFRQSPGLGRRAKQVACHPVLIACFAIAAVSLVSTAFAFDPSAAFWSNYSRGEGSFQVLHYCAFLFLLALLFRQPGNWLLLFAVSLAGACFVMLYGLLWAAGMPASLVPQDPPMPDPSGFLGRLTGHRFVGSLGNPIWTASYFAFQLGYLAWLLAARCTVPFTATALVAGSVGSAAAYLGMFSAVRGKPLLASVALVMAAVLLIVPLRFLQSRFRNLISVAAVLSCAFFFLGFLLAGSRGAALGFIAALLTAAAFLVPARKGWWLASAGVSAVLLGASFFMLRWVSLPGWAQGIAALDLTSGDYRLRYWRTAWTAFLERPLLGWGPQNFTAIHDRYGQVLWWVDHAHSIVFDTLAATGISGTAAILALFAACAWTIYRSVNRSAPLASSARLQLGILAALLVFYVVQGLFSFDWLPVTLNLYLTIACLISLAPEPPAQTATPPRRDKSSVPTAQSRIRRSSIAAAAILVLAWTAYYGNYLPLAKAAAFRIALQSRLDTWDETREAFNRSFSAPAPFGQADLVYEFGYTVAKLLQEKKKTPAEVILWVTYFRSFADPLIARGGVATVRTLEAAAELETAAFKATRDPAYYTAAESDQRRGLSISPVNLILLRSQFELYSAAGQTAEARRCARAAKAIWPPILLPDPEIEAAVFTP